MSAFLETESHFKFEDLFFSRTDRKGIIQSGNSVFQSVSKFSWDEILQRPHNVIRHPAMPRGVFHLFWEAILSNKQIGAYVVNKAKDGSYYWVFALVSPIEGGFLSVRLKPSSTLFEAIKKEYVHLLQLEAEKKFSPTESQKILNERIQALSYRDYPHFMIEALTLEMESRQKKLGKEDIPILNQLKEMAELGTGLQKKCQDIFSAYRQNAFVPLNLEVQAARIGQQAAPVAVIATQYNNVAKEIQIETNKLLEAGNLVQARAASSCKFDICTSLLQREVALVFQSENKDMPIDKNIEMAFLKGLEQKGFSNAKESFSLLEDDFEKFRSIYAELKKLTTTLEIVNLTGRMEAVKVKQSPELMSLMGGLNAFKNLLTNTLKEIDHIGIQLMDKASQMKRKVSTGNF